MLEYRGVQEGSSKTVLGQNCRYYGSCPNIGM